MRSKSKPRANKTEKLDQVKVRPTGSTLGVAPPKRSRVPDHPTEPAAVDRRRQIVDENRSGARR
jgi:hypothetical protein